jgi:hypothetical protein
MRLDEESRVKFATLPLSQSEGGWGNKNTWPVDHLDGGFHGVCFKWNDENPPPVKNHIDIMRDWGYTRWLVEKGRQARVGG